MIPAACLVYGVLLGLLRTAVLPALGLMGPGPDLLLPLVVFLGFRPAFVPGLAASVGLGLLGDAFAGAGSGLHAFGCAVAFCLCKLFSGHFLLRGALWVAATTALASLGTEGALQAWARVASFEVPHPEGGALLRAAVDGAFAPVVLAPLHALSRAWQGRREPWTLTGGP